MGDAIVDAILNEDDALHRHAELIRGEADDPEAFHADEDELLRIALRTAGWNRLVDAVENADVQRWYA